MDKVSSRYPSGLSPSDMDSRNHLITCQFRADFDNAHQIVQNVTMDNPSSPYRPKTGPPPGMIFTRRNGSFPALVLSRL